MTEHWLVESQPAYILHAKPYRETSQLLEVFTRDHGRIGLVAKGSRRPKSRLRSALQLFQPLSISWSGRGELMTLRMAEVIASADNLSGETLMSGFYINELVLKLLRRGDPHRDLFVHYAATLGLLAEAPEDIEATLRRFEVALLDEIGYGLNLQHDAVAHDPLRPEQEYEYLVEKGPVATVSRQGSAMVFNGAELLAIGQGDLSDADVRRSAKRLLRTVLEHHLDGRPLKTRDVFARMKR